MPLHIDYRPEQLDEIVGNESTINQMEAIFDREEDIPHAFLFKGPRGCGKTTFARIIKSLLKCSNEDYLEINAADDNSVAGIRAIISTLPFMPLNGKCRIIVFDEAHRFSGNAQDALLKHLEEAPDHIYFVLCTTDPQKLLPTVCDRCTTFEVSELPDEDIEALIKSTLKKEKVDDMPQEAIENLVDSAEGGPRRALVLLDQIIDLSPDEMIDAAKQAKENEKQSIDLCRALIDTRTNWKDITAIIKSIKGKIDAEGMRRMILGYINSVVLNSNTVDPRLLLIHEFFKDPFYHGGYTDLTMACANIFLEE